MAELLNLLGQVIFRVDGTKIFSIKDDCIAYVDGRNLINLSGQVIAHYERNIVTNNWKQPICSYNDLGVIGHEDCVIAYFSQANECERGALAAGYTVYLIEQ